MKTIILLMLLGVVAVVKTALVNDGEVDQLEELEDLISILLEPQDDSEIIKLNKKQDDKAYDSGGDSLVRGKVLETIPSLPKYWSLSVDIKPLGKVSGWNSIIHATQGSDGTSYGDRTPFISFYPGTNQLYIVSSVNGNPNHVYHASTPLLPNGFTNVKIEQTQHGYGGVMYSIYVGGLKVYYVENRDAREFKNVKVYASDPWYPKAAAVILNYKFDYGGDNLAVDYGGDNLVVGKVLETVPSLPKVWSLSVDIKPISSPVSGWNSIIHATQGSDGTSYGDRTPFISFYPGTNQLYIVSSVNGNPNHLYHHSKPLSPNVFTNVKIEQTPEYIHYSIFRRIAIKYSIYVGGIKVYTIYNDDPKEFTNVKVYASDPWYPRASAVIRNYKFDQVKWEKVVARS